MIKFFKLDDGAQVVIETAESKDGKETLFVASAEADEDAFSCDYILTKVDTRKFRDALDEWLQEDEE